MIDAIRSTGNAFEALGKIDHGLIQVGSPTSPGVEMQCGAVGGKFHQSTEAGHVNVCRGPQCCCKAHVGNAREHTPHRDHNDQAQFQVVKQQARQILIRKTCAQIHIAPTEETVNGSAGDVKCQHIHIINICTVSAEVETLQAGFGCSRKDRIRDLCDVRIEAGGDIHAANLLRFEGEGAAEADAVVQCHARSDFYRRC